MMKRFAIALLVAAIAGCGSPQTVAVAGKLAPDWTLPTAGGANISLASYRGKAVYMNFFATWCHPCNVETPGIEVLSHRYASRGLQIIGVDEFEGAQKARSFVKKFGLTYPAVVDGGTLRDQYNVNGLPVHVFVKRDGTIASIRAGEMSRAEIESAIRAIL